MVSLYKSIIQWFSVKPLDNLTFSVGLFNSENRSINITYYTYQLNASLKNKYLRNIKSFHKHYTDALVPPSYI